jgi:glucokinase
MDAARGADASARAAIDEIVGWLGIGLASLINIADPGLVVLGGVLDRHADLFFPALEEATRSHVYPPLQSKLRVITTSFGADVGVVGAASIALDEVVFGTAQDPAASS